MSLRETSHRIGSVGYGLIDRLNAVVSRNREHVSTAQLVAGLAYLFLLLGVAFCIIVLYSFLQQAPPQGSLSFTLSNYVEFLGDAFYRSILVDSILIGVKVTVATLLIAYPVAYFLAFTESEHKNLLVLLVVLPFWINIVIRTYAWRLILGRQGVVNYLFVDVLALSAAPGDYLFSQDAVVLGLVHVFLPFMLLPIFTSLNNFDGTQIEAAKNLGANGLQAFYEVTLPQSLPGVAAGVSIVYVLAFGSFVIPLLLGGQTNIMIANVIGQMFGEFQNWGLGSAIAIVVTALSLSLVFVFNRLVGIGDVYGGDA